MSDVHKLPVVVLISGSGSNLQALMDASAGSAYRIVGVISNKADARGLQRAADAGIATAVVDHLAFDSRETFDAALIEHIDAFSPGLIVLAGFMRILTPGFVRHYTGRLLNIHPSLLPKYQGLNTHQRAIDAGDAEHGASVHFVTEELDGGPVVAQARVPIEDTDQAKTLAARVLSVEHTLYPAVVDWFARGRLTWRADTPMLDGRPLINPVLLT